MSGSVSSLLLLFALNAIAEGIERPLRGLPLVGESVHYSVREGDSLALIGARYGVDARVVARRNRLSPEARLKVGLVLEVDNRHIIPRFIEDGILINVPQRLLFYFDQGQLVSWYPVGLGRPSWATPIGSFHVVTRETDPAWDVPASIQQEMRREGKKVRTRVPPGPDNPLGRYWFGLSGSLCGIHGTNVPASIYGFRTHGCIRLHPDDIAALFQRVTIGTPVEIIYEPLLLAQDKDGTVLLEVHPDIYGRAGDRFRGAERFAKARGLEQATSSPLWNPTVRMQEGTAIPVARSSDTE